jgi:hypothetical protein
MCSGVAAIGGWGWKVGAQHARAVAAKLIIIIIIKDT